MTEVDQEPIETDPPDAAEVERLQVPMPIAGMVGHEVCADLHTTLALAQSVMTSRDERVADLPGDDSSEALLRELRALGVAEAAPYLVAMMALVDAAVDRLAASGDGDREAAWTQVRRDVLRSHCQSPDQVPTP